MTDLGRAAGDVGTAGRPRRYGTAVAFIYVDPPAAPGGWWYARYEGADGHASVLAPTPYRALLALGRDLRRHGLRLKARGAVREQPEPDWNLHPWRRDRP